MYKLFRGIGNTPFVITNTNLTLCWATDYLSDGVTNAINQITINDAWNGNIYKDEIGIFITDFTSKESLVKEYPELFV